jgi:hypothetical protein
MTVDRFRRLRLRGSSCTETQRLLIREAASGGTTLDP